MKPAPATLPPLLTKALWYTTLVIIVGLPFHVLIYSLLLAHLPSLASPFKSWKEGLTVLMATGGGLAVLAHPALRRRLWRDPLSWLIALFTLLNVGFGFITPDHAAAILAIKINVVFLLLYWAAGLGAATKPYAARERILLGCLLIPAVIVGLFGVAQLAVLPRAFLTHLGYGFGAGQIQPYELIANSQVLRIQSILFGPNQFGSYLVLPLVAAVWAAWRARSRWVKIGLSLLAALLLFLLYASQSRSAWLGGLLGFFVLGWVMLKRRGRITLIVTALVLSLAALGSWPLISHSRWGVIIRHNSGHGVTASNTLHIERGETGWHKLLSHPLGTNLDAVGRASDLVGQSFYTENFYLQIADQMGWEGLLLFVAILLVVASRLWLARIDTPFAVPLLASLIGLSLTNIFAQTWSDGATALLWWGAAGAVLGNAVVTRERT